MFDRAAHISVNYGVRPSMYIMNEDDVINYM